LGCDDGPFEASDWNEVNPDIEVSHLERWANETRALYSLPELTASDRIKIVLNATAIGVDLSREGRGIEGIRVAHEGRMATFRGATFYVLAQGGIETARFLLNVQAEHPRLFGGARTHLGRHYMGHLSGSIATIRFYDPATAYYFDNVSGLKSFARRRLTITQETQRRYGLPNVSFWPENTNYFDPAHASGILSAAALVIRIPGIGPRIVSEAIRQQQHNNFPPRSIWPHFSNIVQDAQGVMSGAAEMLRQRVRYGRRLPRLFVTNRHGLYPLRFHSEQLPDPQNRIRLSEERDWLGLRRAIIDFNFSVDDMRHIIHAHKVLDRSLRRLRLGELIYKVPESRLDPAEQGQHLAKDGLHQIGLTRMAASATAGVVDPNCKVFEFENLFVASSSVFPTSGQAPPTLPAVALALRLSEHIAKRLERLRDSVQCRGGGVSRSLVGDA
jgi:choline dehydrogenase-like flavoprotein